MSIGSVYSGIRPDSRNGRILHRAGAADISFILCAEGGGISTPLGGGMTEVTAHGLLTDVSRILSLA